MATIDGFQIPDYIISEFKQIISKINSSSLRFYAKSKPDLFKGFRPQSINLKIIRQRLVTKVTGEGELEPILRDFLANESLNIEFVTVLSESVLSLFFPLFVSFLGTGFIIGALLDDRESVRELAISYLKENRFEKDMEEKEEAISTLKDGLIPFLQHVALLTADQKVLFDFDKSEKEKDLVNRLKKFQNKVTELEKKLEDSQDSQRLKKLLNQKITTKDDELDNVKDTLIRERNQKNELLGNLDKAKVEIAVLKKEFDRSLSKEINRELSHRVRGWLIGPLQLEKEASAFGVGKEDDLLLRAEKLLVHQAAVDRNSGNRRILAERLAASEDARNKIVQSAKEALNPLPGLKKIILELEEEINRIKKILGISEPTNQILLNLQAKINGAASLNELNLIKELLFDLTKFCVVGSHDLSLLYTIYHRRMESLYDKYGYHQMRQEGVTDPGWLVKNMIGSNQDFHLILDGYNILFGLGDLFDEYYENNTPAFKARHRLLEMVDDMLAESSCMASVFFDGERSAERSFSSRVKEVFSGGGDTKVKNRADKAIVDYLDAIGTKENGLPVIVVTNDVELQGLARERGARVMPVPQFSLFLSAGNYSA